MKKTFTLIQAKITAARYLADRIEAEEPNKKFGIDYVVVGINVFEEPSLVYFKHLPMKNKIVSDEMASRLFKKSYRRDKEFLFRFEVDITIGKVELTTLFEPDKPLLIDQDTITNLHESQSAKRIAKRYIKNNESLFPKFFSDMIVVGTEPSHYPSLYAEKLFTKVIPINEAITDKDIETAIRLFKKYCNPNNEYLIKVTADRKTNGMSAEILFHPIKGLDKQWSTQSLN